MTALITNPEPVRTWVAYDIDGENRDLPREYPSYDLPALFGQENIDGVLQVTCLPTVNFEGDGVPTGEQVPYFVMTETPEVENHLPTHVWDRYWSTYTDHAIRLAAQVSREFGYQAFVFYVETVESRFYLVSDFNDHEEFSMEDMERDLHAIWWMPKD